MSTMVAPVHAAGLGNRAHNLARLATEQFDVLVIGGGITGAGIALDAASRGIKVALVERNDFASGTSSRSSKLVHGGLRYVAEYQFRVTREASEERYQLQRLAPHLVRSVPFLLPVYGGFKETTKLSAGLWLYDILATLRNTHLHRRLSPTQVHDMVPSLTTEGLDGGFVYYDCRTDDARLTIEVLKTAAAFGAVVVNHAQVEDFMRSRDQIAGVGVRDHIRGTSIEVRAHTVVAATGVWIDTLRPKADRGALPVTRPAKGVHLVLPEQRIGNGDVAMTLQTSRDHRITFVIPWMGRTLVGTTDTEYEGRLDQPRATVDDVDYLMEAIVRAFPERHLSAADILTVQAGLRPLVNDPGASTTGISREDRVFEGESGLISIAGGKLTTYRRMARKVVDIVARRLGTAGVDGIGPCRTGSIAIGGTMDDPVPAIGTLGEETQAHLLHLYGGQASTIASLLGDHPNLAARLVPGLPHVAAQVVYAARWEMGVTVSDVLIRRLRLANLDGGLALGCLHLVVPLLAQELGWSASEATAQMDNYREEVEQFAVPGRASIAASQGQESL